MAKRRSSNKRSSLFSRGSGGSNVLNPDTNVIDEEQPYWWRNLENNTIAIPFTDSSNFNHTSRRLNSNSSIEMNFNLGDDWWKILEGTQRNSKSLQKNKDLSKKDGKDGATSVSESEEEVKIAKKKPQLRAGTKNVDGNAFLCALKEPKVVLIPLEKDNSIAHRCMSTMRMFENGSDLSSCPLPNATSTPLERSLMSQENSNSDTEPLLKKTKPKAKLLRRYKIDMKKNLFENILMEVKTIGGEEEAAHRSSASAVEDKTAKEPESQIVENEKKLEVVNKKLHSTKKTDRKVSESKSSDTSHDFLEPMKPKSRFLSQPKTQKGNLFQKILSDSDSSTPNVTLNGSQNRKSTREMRRPSLISTESNEDVNLRLSTSSNISDIDIIRTGNKKAPSPPNSPNEIPSSQPPHRISNAVKTSLDRSVLSSQEDRDASRLKYQTQLYSDSDEEVNGTASDVTLLIAASKSPNEQSRSTIPSETIPKQNDIPETQQRRKNSDEQAVASLTKGSVEVNDSTVAESADDASDTEFRDLNRSRKRTLSRSAKDIAAEETAMSTMKSKKHCSSANFKEDRASSESPVRPPSRRKSKRSTASQQRISFIENDEQSDELGNTTPRLSKRSEVARTTFETMNVGTPRKDSKSRDSNRLQKRTTSRSVQEIVMEETAMSPSPMKSREHSRAESSVRSPSRRESKRSTTVQQRISFKESDEQTHDPGNATPRRSKRSEVARRTSETENVPKPEKDSRDAVKDSKSRGSIRSQKRTTSRSAQEIIMEETAMSTSTMKSQEHSRSSVNLNKDGPSSEEESSARSPSRRQSKRSTTAQQRISFMQNDEQTHQLGGTTPRRSKMSEVARRTSEMENFRTPRKDSKSLETNRSQKRTTSRSAQNYVEEETATSTIISQEHSRSVNSNEDGPSSEEESSARSPSRRQSKRSTTAQQRISFMQNDEQTHQLGGTTPRRSKMSEVARRTSEMENIRTPRKDSKSLETNRSQKRTTSRSAQNYVEEETATSTIISQEHSRSVNSNEDRASSEEESSARSPSRRQSKRSTTAQQRISFMQNDEQTHQLGGTTPRRSKMSEVARRTSEMENFRTPRKDSKSLETNRSQKRTTSRSAQNYVEEETATSTIISQEHSRSVNSNEDGPSSEEESSARSPSRRQSKRSTTAQQRISFMQNDEQTHQLGGTTPRRSKMSEVARRTSEMENFRTPRKDSKSLETNRSQKRTTSRSAQNYVEEETATSTITSQEHSRSVNSNEDRASSEEESSARSPSRRQSKRSTTAQQRISFMQNDEQTHQLGGTTPRRSKMSEVARRTSEMENFRTPRKDSKSLETNRSQKRTTSRSAQNYVEEETATSTIISQEHSRSVNSNEDGPSSEEESSARSPSRRQSKRSTTAQQRISFMQNDEQTHQLGGTTPRRSKMSEVARRTSEMENFRTPRKDSKSLETNRSQKRTTSRSAQNYVEEETATSTITSQEHSRSVNSNEDRASSEEESSARSPSRRQSKRSTTAQQRISFMQNDEQTHQLGGTTPRRSKMSEVARRTSEMENFRTPRKDSKSLETNRSQKRTTSRSAQNYVEEETATSTIISQEHSRSVNSNEDGPSSEESSARSPSRRQSKRSTTAQQRISFMQNDEQTHQLGGTTPRRSTMSEVARRTSEMENFRTPRKDSKSLETNRSQKRPTSRSAQNDVEEETAMSTIISQEHSRSVNFNEDRASSEEESSVRSPSRHQSKRSTTSQRRISFMENDEQTHQLGGTTPRRSKGVETAQGTLQSQRSRQTLLETPGTPSLYRPGTSKSGSAMVLPKSQRVLEDFFQTNSTGISASQALSNPEMALDIRKKMDEVKKQELQLMEEIRKQPVAEKKIKWGKGLRPQPNKQNPIPKKVDKAYLVNGLVYKRPRLPRPKKWVTDYLYRYLWKQMEPKYKENTRVKSEKFVSRLCQITDVIAKAKTYPNYKNELHALMKEMARLQIIHTRHDFHIFCQDYLPYELRVKMIPILLPGNHRTIPFNPDKLFTPLISSP